MSSIDDFKVRVLNKILSTDQVESRVHQYINDLIMATDENKNLRKAIEMQLLHIIQREHAVLKKNLGLYYNAERRTKRRKKYSPTDYVMFCREMKTTYPDMKFSGKMQSLWKARRDKDEKKFDDILKQGLDEEELKAIDQLQEYAKNAERFARGNINID